MDFEAFAKRFNWSRSQWDSIRTVQADTKKVHFAVHFTRFNPQGEAYISFNPYTYCNAPMLDGAFAPGLVSRPDSEHSMTVLVSAGCYLPEAGASIGPCYPSASCLHSAHNTVCLAKPSCSIEATVIIGAFARGSVTALFAVHGGTFYASDFSPQGLQFLQRYLPRLSQTLPNFWRGLLRIKDDWANYQRLADVMIRHLWRTSAPQPMEQY